MLDRDCYVLCHPNEKRPIGLGWGKNPLSLEEVRHRLQTKPDLNVGILLGARTGIIDVECDSPEAAVALPQLIPQDVLDHCPSWQSPRGTHHGFAFHDRLAGCPAVVKVQGVEFRLGTDKQLQSLIPPSRVDGVAREWINAKGALQPLPDAVIDLVIASAAKASGSVDSEPDPLFAGLGLDSHKLAKITSYFDRNGIPYNVERLRHGGFKVHILGCLFKGGDDGDPVVLIGADGSHGFRCQHAKCAALRWDDVEALFGPLDPVIRIGCDLDANVRDAIRALGTARNVFQRAGVLVQVTDEAPVPKLCLQTNGSPKLAPLVPATLAPILSSCARFEKRDGRKKGDAWVRCLPPTNIVNAVAAATDLPGIPSIFGIVSCPVLRADGSILVEPGYDPLTGLYLDSRDQFPALEEPSAAVASLRDVLADFPFASPVHETAAIALVVTMLARPAFAGPAPFFLVDANASRAGKGLLTDVATTIVEGRKAARFSPPTSDDEFRKTITTAALSGASYVLFDNIKAKFGGQALENALTCGRWTDRLLGGNKSVDLELNWVWAGTANNAVLTADMIGRTCHIRLDVQVERPELRSDFRHADLIGFVRDNRRKLAMAALSIPAAYIRAGRPDMKLPAWGGFEGWSALVRNSIVWAGLTDPGETREALREAADDETETLRMLVTGWKELGFPATVAVALETLENSGWQGTDPYPTLRAVVAELPRGDKRNDVLGKMLRSANGKVVGGFKFANAGKKWSVLPIDAKQVAA